MRLSLEGFGMSEENTNTKGLSAFVRIHQTSGSIAEAAEKLGIDEIKYKKRLSVYNHRLKKMGYLPLERHDKKITSTEKALQSLEAEGLLQRAPERPKKEWEKRLDRMTEGVRNLNSPVQTSIFGED